MSLEIRAPSDVHVASQYGLNDWHDGEWMIARGCAKVSPGCVNCSSARAAIYTPAANATPTGADWTGEVEMLHEQLLTPSTWQRPLKLFVGGSTDFWHDGISDEFRAEVWKLACQYTQHVFGFLTKRAANMRAWFTRTAVSVPDHIWLGTTVETDAYRERLDDLLAIPARTRYAQCEPLLERVHLKSYLGHGAINWVVAGPEWGCPDPRPCQPVWMRQIRDDCAGAGVPFFTRHILDGAEQRELPST